MNRIPVLAAFAVAALAASASAQARRVGWDSDLGTPSVRDLIQAEPAPAPPAAAPAAPSSAKAADCPDGKELEGRAMRLTLKIKGKDKPLVLELAYVRCEVEFPRDEPPAPDYTFRSYKTAGGDYLGVYTNRESPTSTLSIHLADGSSSATLIPTLRTADLASGRTLGLGEILLVGRAVGDQEGAVIDAVGAIRSVPAK
ncbi:MAG TPA: hypothetical protein VH309_14610 [Elusimicrobiota bacterium]|nr:hypothetical protein [Elusimicrobiota bacterium]